jgi:hypothetical protein
MTGEWWQGQREISERGIASSRRRASHVGSFPRKRLMEVGNESCGVVVSEVGAERGGHVELGQLAWHGAARRTGSRWTAHITRWRRCLLA